MTDLDGPYLVHMALASIIAAVGLLTDSLVLIVGAMILGPSSAPCRPLRRGRVSRRLAGTAVAPRTRRRVRRRRAGRARLHRGRTGDRASPRTSWATRS